MDKFRIKITDKGSGGLVYDNKLGESDNGRHRAWGWEHHYS